MISFLNDNSNEEGNTSKPDMDEVVNKINDIIEWINEQGGKND